MFLVMVLHWNRNIMMELLIITFVPMKNTVVLKRASFHFSPHSLLQLQTFSWWRKQIESIPEELHLNMARKEMLTTSAKAMKQLSFYRIAVPVCAREIHCDSLLSTAYSTAYPSYISQLIVKFDSSSLVSPIQYHCHLKLLQQKLKVGYLCG